MIFGTSTCWPFPAASVNKNVLSYQVLSLDVVANSNPVLKQDDIFKLLSLEHHQLILS